MRTPRLGVVAVLTLAAVGLTVPSAASAAAPSFSVAPSVAGIAGGALRIALSADASRLYVVDGSGTVQIVDTATSSVVGASPDLSAGGYGIPVDVSVVADRPEVSVTTSTGWVVTLHPDGTIADTMGLPGTALVAGAAVPSGPTVVTAPGGSDPTRLLRYNLGLSVSPISFAPEAPSQLGRLAVGPGDGNDNDILVSGAVGGSGALFLFDSPFALSGPVRTVTLPGTAIADNVALSDDGTTALATSGWTARAFLVNVDETSPGYGTVTAVIDLPVPARAAVFSHDGAHVFAVGANHLYTIDVATGALAADSVDVTVDATSAALSPSGNRLWVGTAMDGLGLLSRAAVSANPTDATVGTATSATFSSSGFDLPVTYSLTPALPAGLVLDAATGIVSGTPTAPSASTVFSVTATSGDSVSATTSWTLAVAPASPAPGEPSASPSSTPTTSPSPSVSATPAPSVSATVTTTSSRLPSTGAPAVTVAALTGLALLALGGLAVILVRRNRRRATR